MGGGCWGGCAGVNGSLVEPVEMAAWRLMSVCLDSKCAMGSGYGDAPAPLPGCPQLDAQGGGRRGGQMA